MADEESTAAPTRGPAGGGAKGEARPVELDKRAQAFARRVAESKAIVPHAYLRRHVRVGGGKLGAARLAAAAAAALADHPRLNSSYRDGAIEEYPRANLALAVEPSTAGGVPQYPVLADAGARGEAELEAEIAALRNRAESGSLASPDLSGATFTLTLIERGADELLPVITPGQAAHLAVGRVREAALALGGAVEVGRIATLTLAVDHRAVDATAAAAFLGRLGELLEAED